MKYTDLHIHTYFSDGTFTSEEVITQALSGGLSAIAVTDHDTVEAVDELISIAQDKIEIIPGVELTAEMEKKEIHILGYFIDWENTDFQRELQSLQKIRLERMGKMVEKLNKLGIEISSADVLKFAGPGSVGRLHLARMMKDRGYIGSIREAFQRFIGEGQPAYVGEFKLSSNEAIRIIKAAGGLAVLAHPYLLGHDEWIVKFIQQGLDGIEVYYNNQNAQITLHYERLAYKHKLLLTGGSDCHGLAKGRVFLGKFKLPYSLVEKLKQAKTDKALT